MKRYEVEPGRFVPTDPRGEPELCRCKPWHLCHHCGLFEHAGSWCSWCKRKDALEVLVKRPFGAIQAAERAKRRQSAQW